MNALSTVLPREFRVLVASPAGTCDPSLPIAAARAGGLGLLDVTYGRDLSRVAWSLDRLHRLAGGATGIIVRDSFGDLEIMAHAAANECSTVLLSCERAIDRQRMDELSTTVAKWREVARQVGSVVTSVEEFEVARDVGVDFVVAKGNEAGGVTGEETSFVLLQRLLRRSADQPVYVWGGVGLHTAAACRIAGAAGALVDWQLALTKESPLPYRTRLQIRQMDGSETVQIKTPDGRWLRCYSQPGITAAQRLQELRDAIRSGEHEDDEWQAAIDSLVHAEPIEDRLLLTGQDACFAASWTGNGATVAQALGRLRREVAEAIDGCHRDSPLARGAALAVSHGTEFPLVQGPMTRVSDTAAFCDAVQRGGGLPFLALALMRGPDVRRLLEQTRQLMGPRPWGVGLLGFVPRELREEQLAVIEEVRPPFAVIAGGRPDQAARLEALGTATYLHVPSPAMLEIFIQEGARRFIFEGRECGGHVGPRSSFVLWDAMVRVLAEAELTDEEAGKVHVLFAGGIHDGMSAAMVSSLAQPLLRRGMKIGGLMGTAYLYTTEAVETDAILDVFQEVARGAERTVLLETGPGHAIRCVPTPYTEAFEVAKSEMQREGRHPDEIRDDLERTNMGRLRIASKGIQRAAAAEGQDPFVKLSAEEQRREGMYMIGQVAPMCRPSCTIRELHEHVCDGASEWLDAATRTVAVTAVPSPPPPPPLDIAIVGMSCFLPGAKDPQTFWENILAKRDHLARVPADRFDVDRWYDPQRGTPDKFYTDKGGFVTEILFDPFKYGIPPASIPSIEPVQLLALELVDQALRDAGYGGYGGDHPFRERCSIILGAGGGAGELGTQYAFRSCLPQFFENVDQRLLEELPAWTEDSFAGILMNVIAGRVANRYDLGGVNFTVDAACASSLAAVYLACRELSDRTSDMAIAGGCDGVQTPFGYLCFATAGALSPRGKSSTFDANADGIAISEGLATVVLKRLEDAERDGDRIYAVIRAAAGGSDGRSLGMTAPRREGQVRTYERAYAQARFPIASVELFEAHGTGTARGDRTECDSLTELLRQHGAAVHNSAIGSVKSNIGHTKCTAGVAGLLKAALSVYHQVLPPTAHVDAVDAKSSLVDGPIYANTELRPWVRNEFPRRAAVSAFGFGGTNFHVVLEEYERSPHSDVAHTTHRNWAAELFTFSAATRQNLANQVGRVTRQIEAAVESGSEIALADLGGALHWSQNMRTQPLRAAVVASTVGQLVDRLGTLARGLTQPETQASQSPDGVYFEENPLAADEDALAMLFPGQGSQFPNMLRDLAVEFAEVQESFALADHVLRDCYDRRLSRFVFPIPAFSEEARSRQAEQLKATHVAQPALGASEVGALHLLRALSIAPSMVAGHSYGELVGLHVAGVLDEPSLLRLSQARGRAMADIAQGNGPVDLGTMSAVNADEATVRRRIGGLPEVWIANFNSPRQTVISGSGPGVSRAAEVLQAEGLTVIPLPVACAFHTPIMAPAEQQFREALQATVFQPPHLPVYSNSQAGRYPDDIEAVPQLLCEQLLRPVRFVEMIENMYAAGGRVFLEVGPQAVLSKLVTATLGDRPHAAIALQPRQEDGITSLLHALGRLYAHGVAMNLDWLHQRRGLKSIDLRHLARSDNGKPQPHLWRVNGGYARPLHEAPRKTQAKFLVTASEDTASAPTSDVSPRVESVPAVSPVPTVEAGNGAPTTDKAPIPAAAGHRSTVPAPLTETMPREHTPTAEPNPPTASMLGDGRAAALFQETMRQFLRTQQAVMQSYFAGHPATDGHRGVQTVAPPDVPRQPAVPVQAAVPSAFSPPMVPSPTVAPVSQSSSLVPERPSPEEALVPAAKSVDLEVRLLQIVSERTGYPPEMLDHQANMEADLGIDSIKRVEIIASFRREVLPSLEEPPSWFMEQMTAAKTMEEILAGMKQLLDGAEEESQASMDAESATDGRLVAQPEAAGLATVELEEMLITIVSERTGYPPDMLNLDVNLEAELGIDSIKRVEIIATFRRQAVPAIEDPPSWFMEQMTAAKTLREIEQGVVQLTGSPAEGVLPTTDGSAVESADGDASHAPSSESDESAAEAAPRCLVMPCNCPLTITGTLPPGLILLAGGDELMARAVGTELKSKGGLVEFLPTEALQSRQHAEAAVELIRAQHGEIAGAVLLQALSPAPIFPEEVDADTWWHHTQSELASALFLMQALAYELKRGVFFGCFSTGGGDFDPLGDAEAVRPWRGGLAGMLKSAAKEWPQSTFRVIDLPESMADELPDMIEREWQVEGPVEIGYREERRFTVRPVRDELRPSDLVDSTLDADSVVLVTGGGRGITAEIALELAERVQPKLVLLGRTELPEAPEDPGTAAVTDENDLRTMLLEQARTSHAAVSPKEIEAKLRRLLAQREVRRTLAAAEQAGATVVYRRCDVTDDAALQQVVAEIQAQFGSINAVIHGAGIIEDKYIVDKTPDSFDRVLRVKLSPVLTLMRVLEPEPLRMFMLFTSVAGYFGNVGQCDYAAANEILNRIARRLHHLWPHAAVTAINWGPWQGPGMITPELARQFASRGISLVHPAAGRQAAWREIRCGGPHVRALIGSGPWLAEAGSIDNELRAMPLLHNAMLRRNDEVVEVDVTLQPDQNLYLDHHRIDDKPVLPFTVGMEMMAQTVAACRPEWHVVRLKSIRRYRGLVIDSAAHQMVIRAEPIEERDATGQWRVRMLDADARPLYECLVELAAEPLQAPPPPEPALAPNPFLLSPHEAYERWLFHGPTFHVIRELPAYHERGIDAVVQACPQPAGSSNQHGWQLNPVVLDTGPQLMILWSRAQCGTTSLPNHVDVYERFRDFRDGFVNVSVRTRVPTTSESVQADVWFVQEGMVCGLMRGLECTSSTALNRISEKGRR